jgi:hypothetical protein
VEDSIEEEKERLRAATAYETEELKDAVGELATAARSQAHEAIETGRWLSLYAGFSLGLFFGLKG